MLPYKSSSLVQNVFAVHRFDRRGRRLAVRTAMEHPIGALPRTPFPASRDFPSRGNEKIGGTGYCVTYDTDSQSRNAGFILIALRAIPQPSGPKAPSNLRTRPPSGRSILRTFPFTTLLHNLPPSGGHNPRGEAPSTLGPKELSISLFHRASPGCRPCLSRRHSPVRPVSWLLFCCGRRSGSRR